MEEAALPITLPKLLKKYPVVLLRGKPGCGKTTLLRHIALSFARGEEKAKLDWRGPAPLPLLVSLRNFGAFLKGLGGRRFTEPQPTALLMYLETTLRDAGVRFSPRFLLAEPCDYCSRDRHPKAAARAIGSHPGKSESER